MIEKAPEATTTWSSEEEIKSDKLNFQWHVKVAAILITCAQSFSNKKHEVNCGRATVHVRPPVARAKRNSVSCAVTLEVFPMGKSLELGSLWVLIDHFHICDHHYSDKLRKEKLEPRFVGNTTVLLNGGTQFSVNYYFFSSSSQLTTNFGWLLTFTFLQRILFRHNPNFPSLSKSITFGGRP